MDVREADLRIEPLFGSPSGGKTASRLRHWESGLLRPQTDDRARSSAVSAPTASTTVASEQRARDRRGGERAAAVLITFSGLDGAGKTTLINWLRTTLERQARPVAVLHMNEQVGLYAYARSIRNRVWGSRTRENGRAAAQRTEGPPVGGPPFGSAEDRLGSRLSQIRYAILWNKPVRRLIYPVDLLIFLGYRLWVEGIRRKILLMDRYFYDTLVDVADGRNWDLLRLLERITPVPDVSVFLDVDPEVACRRKGEQTVSYLRHRWAAYREVFQWVRPTVKLTDVGLGDAQSILQQVVLERLSPR